MQINKIAVKVHFLIIHLNLLENFFELVAHTQSAATGGIVIGIVFVMVSVVSVGLLVKRFLMHKSDSSKVDNSRQRKEVSPQGNQ